MVAAAVVAAAAGEGRLAVTVVPRAPAGCAAAAVQSHQPGGQGHSCTRAEQVAGVAAPVPQSGRAAVGKQGLPSALSARGMSCCRHPWQIALVEARCRKVQGNDTDKAVSSEQTPAPVVQ